jgi:hypothetical protein
VTNSDELTGAIIDRFITHWTHCAMCIKGSGGFDLSGTNPPDKNVYDLGIDFIEFEYNDSGRTSAGINRDSGVRVLGFLDVQIFTQLGFGNMRLAEIERHLFTLLERQTIATAQVRPALSAGRPYEFRGKLTKVISFPFEYFQS